MKFASSFTPPPRELVAALEQRIPGLLPAFVERLDAGTRGLDVTATSWWRGAATNADVGGAQFSQHLLALAVDLDGPDRLVARDRLSRLGLPVIFHSVPGGRPHVHVQALPAGLVQSLWGSSSSGG